jgi:hypothetical protein
VRLARLLLAALALGLHPAEGWALELAVAGPERILFDQARDACDASHLPDAPARAFRDAAGEMVVFAPNFRNRAMIGADLSSLKRDCAVRYAAEGSPDPALLDDRTWLHAFHTDDGTHVFALASASFIPYRHGERCLAGARRTDCWINGIVALASSDGGRTFEDTAPPPRNAVLPPPSPYRPDVADPPSFVTATNIVTVDGYLYSIVWRRDADRERSRNCLIRATEGDTDHWSVWNGATFVPLAERTAPGWSVQNLDCARIGPPGLPAIRGLVYAPESRTFAAVFQHRRRDAGGAVEAGFFYATSPDLVAWSRPKLLLAVPLRADTGGKSDFAAYPSLIDDTSPDRNFSTVGRSADLVYVRIAPHGDGGRPSRALVAVPLAVTP